MNYGGEWSEPPESYIVLVCSVGGPLTDPCHTLYAALEFIMSKSITVGWVSDDMALACRALRTASGRMTTAS